MKIHPDGTLEGSPEELAAYKAKQQPQVLKSCDPPYIPPHVKDYYFKNRKWYERAGDDPLDAWWGKTTCEQTTVDAEWMKYQPMTLC